MKQEWGFGWFSFVTTLMFVIGIIGIGFFLLFLLFPGLFWKADDFILLVDDVTLDIPAGVLKTNEERRTAAIVHEYSDFSQPESVDQFLDEFDTMDIDEILGWLEPMNDDNLTFDLDEFDVHEEYTNSNNSEFSPTLEQQRRAELIMQQLYDGTENIEK